MKARIFNDMIKEVTVKDILNCDKFIFISHIGTLIDFYAALHPDEVPESPHLAQYIANCVKQVNEINQITPEQAQDFMKGE